jgi:nucleotide-binding universal stress UspA family protein
MEPLMSKQFNKILVPLDAGEISDRALDVAIDMAHKYGATLIAVSVRRDPVDLNQERTVADLEEVEAEFKSLEDRVRKHIAGVAPLDASQVKVEVRAGNVVMAIVDAATENHVDLIVMGTHGRVGLADRLVGSTTERVQKKVTASVLAVRPLGFPYLRD